jgi:protein-S-isoprenylcysteine O-methyltransferase
MRPGPLYIETPLWAVVFWVSFAALALHEMWVFSRDRRKVNGQQRDRGSLWVIALLQNVGFFSCFAIPWMTARGRLLFEDEALFWTAIGLFWIGWLLRFWAVVTLGKFFRTTVMVQDDHQLISSGPYRVLRNPSYTGALLMLLGIGLAQGNAYSVAAIVGGGLLAYAWRVRVEEIALRERFGQSFEDYMRRTWAVIPLIW